MKTNKAQISISILIFACLFLVFSPVILSNNYIRQDDLMWEIWPGMKMSDFGYLYYNTVFQLVRPLCMFSFYWTDLISIDIHNAVYIRLMSVILLGTLGILLYFWQLFFNSNRLLAATFAISSFTLPAFQVFAATGNYSLIINALLLTFIGSFFWYYAVLTETTKKKGCYYFFGYLFLFASLLEYPLSSMYIWALLIICLLNSLIITDVNRPQKIRFFYVASFNTIFLMGFYYVFSRFFHYILHVDLSSGRSTLLDTSNLFLRILHIFDVFNWHAELWLWHDISSFYLPAFVVCTLFLLALIFINLNNRIDVRTMGKNIIKTLVLVFALFFFSYSPIMAVPEVAPTFRYTLTTMPILLYLIFWSINEIGKFQVINRYLSSNVTKTICSAFLVCITIFGSCYANMMLADAIVGPHTQDFGFIQEQLDIKVIPLLKQNQRVLIHAIACDEGTPAYFEYDMRICQYQQQVIGVIIHSLRKMGYKSNFDQHNKVIYNEKEIIVKDAPWGTLVVNSPSNSTHDLTECNENKLPVITIDTREMQPYQRFDFYKHLLGLAKT